MSCVGTIAVVEDSALQVVSEWGEWERASGAFRVYKEREFGSGLRA